MSGRLIYLASFPKSGNTWLRIMLSAYRYRDRPLDINDIGVGSQPAHRRDIDRIAGIRLTDLSPEQALVLRSASLDLLGRQPGPPRFYKVHEANLPLPDGSLTFTPASIRAVLYPIRHPFDVAVSFAHHNGRSDDLDATVEMMCNPAFTLTAPIPHRFPQIVGCWSTNARSWLGRDGFATAALRYEDTLRDPAAALRRVVALCWPEDPVDEEAIAHAVAQTRFDRLKELEASGSFLERPLVAKSFFREGRTGAGVSVLTEAQRDRLWQTHAEVMTAFGYNEDGTTEAEPGHVSRVGVLSSAGPPG